MKVFSLAPIAVTNGAGSPILAAEMPASASLDDAALVAATRAGDRDAFGQIVARYQSLICALAYNATGSVRQSEDLAQETFVAAWRDLAQLRETAKLRGWLCSIARHRISREFSRAVREPTHAAESLEAAPELVAPEPPPSEQAISREEQAILWRSLEQIPEAYREPLILFYRENQSVARVADALELSEDAVKQRLARGRKLLQEQVATFVEGALQRTAPGAVFTMSVLGALPALTAPTAAVAAAKAGVTAKATTASGLAVAMLGPVVGILGGWLGYQVSLERNAEPSPREREFLRKLAWRVWLAAGVFLLVLFTGVYFNVAGPQNRAERLVEPYELFCGGYGIALVLTLLSATKRLHEIRREDATSRAPARAAPVKPWLFRSFEYRSRRTLLGLPLIHVRLQQTGAAGRMLPAIGWIAIGNIARGGLFAFGRLALAPISLGGVAVGLVAMGGAGLGVFSLAGAAFGVWAVGGVAAGYLASGGAALGWLGACGGAAMAHDFAVGGVTAAEHANDAAARGFVQQSEFFRWALVLSRNAFVFLWLPLGVVIGQLIGLGRRRSGGSNPPPFPAANSHTNT